MPGEEWGLDDEPISDTGPVAARFIEKFFAHTTAPICIASFDNDRDKGAKAFSEYTREPKVIARYAEKWDQPERGLFFCVSTIRHGLSQQAERQRADRPAC